MGEHAVASSGEAMAQGLADAVCDRRPGGITAVLAPDAELRALLPGGLREWSGAEAIVRRFDRWFGDAELDVAERDVRAIGPRVRARWLLHVRADRFGPGWRTVEQVAYVDGGPDGRIARIDLLCTGYLPEEGSDG